MKICGIIAEYNPFHNGHKIQLDSALSKTKADVCIAIMSGMFTQRGHCAIASKFTRAKMALSQGADIVLELPTCYALQPAEYFAMGGVGILSALNADYISYGTEAISVSDRKIIDDFVNLTNCPTANFEANISVNVKTGIAYPQARVLAFQSVTCHNNVSVLKKPNAILEISYKNAIHTLKSNITPCPIPRVGDSYHQDTPTNYIASATAIRKLIDSADDYSTYMPDMCYQILSSYLEDTSAVTFESMFPYLAHTIATSPQSLSMLPDGSDELTNRMLKAISISTTMEQYIKNVSTKRFSYARVCRAIMHAILGITSVQINKIRSALPLYARVLAIKKDKKEYLGQIVKQSSIPIITSIAKYSPPTSLHEYMLNIDINATNLYNLTLAKHSLYNQDYTEKLTQY